MFLHFLSWFEKAYPPGKEGLSSLGGAVTALHHRALNPVASCVPPISTHPCSPLPGSPRITCSWASDDFLPVHCSPPPAHSQPSSAIAPFGFCHSLGFLTPALCPGRGYPVGKQADSLILMMFKDKLAGVFLIPVVQRCCKAGDVLPSPS